MPLPHGKNGAHWNVVHTRSRHEKKLYDECEKFCQSAYLPLIKSISTHGNRVFEFEKPLFPGYLFCCCRREQRRELFRTKHVANIIEVFDQDGLLRELGEIRKAISCGAPLETFPYLKRGARVVIVKGPFSGIEGIVSHRRGRYRVVLNTSAIKMGAAIEVFADQIEPIKTKVTSLHHARRQ